MTSISVQLFTNSDKLFQGHRVTFKPSMAAGHHGGKSSAYAHRPLSKDATHRPMS